MTEAERCASDGLVERISKIAVEGLSHPDAGSLLHAYVACLSISDLCRAILDSLTASVKIRLALRGRLLRLLRDGNLQQCHQKHLHDLIERSRAVASDQTAVRPVVEALISAVFEFLPAHQQQSIVEAWIDRGTRGAAARWLKAVTQVPALFDENAVMAYFRSTGDDRAAKRLASQASPAFVTEILGELVDRCEVGWIVSRAAMRADTIDDRVWPVIRSKHPATFLYLCARLGRSVSEKDALELVITSPNSIMNHTRGLAIWAVGQMGMISVLDEVVALGDELHQRDFDEFQRYPG
ncbi:hypothetical protein [Bradyrhizobium sp. SZCCHNR3107]|uniref:hypothetical protein n=1 Tax=Bradyrhizobium sp. SZCCHNR3107 TaxID=3057459 RepID=UPI0028E47BFF|nr:hypothetical protein [Bradyrhizobium sp. SZCCHNR3107]